MSDMTDEELIELFRNKTTIYFSQGRRGPKESIFTQIAERLEARNKRIAELEFQLERAKHPEHYAMIDAMNRGNSK